MSKEKALRRLVLASASPRRLQLLRMIGYEPAVRVSDIPEVRGNGEEPSGYVQRLSREKAMAVACGSDEVVLAADTTVALTDARGVIVLEKPESGEDAERMLEALAGRAHEVLTGFSIRFDGELITACERTVVEFGEISAEERRAYVRSGEPMGKAGAYAIQGLAAKFVTRIEGCYPNVVGLPVAAVYRGLRQLPFEIRA
jgi:septum formation protein